MKTIQKFEITIDSRQIAIPKDGQILCVQIHKGGIYIWASVDPKMPIELRNIEVLMTGQEMQSHWRREYIGTVQIYNGDIVLHVFEVWP